MHEKGFFYMIKRNNYLMLKVMILFFVVFFGAYIPLTQRIPYLASIGYNYTEMNLIFAIQAGVGFVYQFVVGFMCDKYKTIKKFVFGAQIIGTVGIFLMFTYTQHQFFYHLIFIALIAAFMNVVIGLLDAWALELDPEIKEHYGVVRGMGTIGWIVGGFVVTRILESFGYSALGLTYTIISLVLLSTAYFVRDAVKAQHSEPITLKDIKLLLTNKRYVLIVMILFFTFILTNSDGLIVVTKMEEFQANDMEKYLRFAIQAVAELPVMFLGAYFMKKYKAINLLMFAIIMYFIRFVAYAFSDTPTLMIAASLMQLLTFPFVMITSKVLVFDNSPEHLKSSGQMLGMGIYMGIGATVTPLITAFFIEMGGIDFSMLALASILIIPIALSFIYKKLDA